MKTLIHIIKERWIKKKKVAKNWKELREFDDDTPLTCPHESQTRKRLKISANLKAGDHSSGDFLKEHNYHLG